MKVHNIAKIEEAGDGMLSFIANPKYEEFIYTTQASILVVNDTLEIDRPVKPTLIRVKDAYSSFALLLEKYQQMTGAGAKTGIQQPSHVPATVKMGTGVFIGAFAYLGENVQLGDNVKIYPGVYLGDNVKIGSGSVLYPGVKVYDHCVLGNRVILHAGCVIGATASGLPAGGRFL